MRREVDELVRAFVARVRERRSGVFVVEGAAGAGKSATLAELVRAARAEGASVRATRATRADAGRPFGCLLDVLDYRQRHDDPAARRVVAALAGVAPAAGTRDDTWHLRVQEAIVDLLRGGAPGPVPVLAVDDAHLADAGTLGVLRTLARATAGEPAIVVWTERSGRNDPALAELRARILDVQHRVVLVPRPGHVTGGRELPRPTADLLGVAAVIGTSFDIATLVALTGRPPAALVGALHPAVDAGVVHAGAVGSYAFAGGEEHASFVAGLASTMRDALHRELGIVLLARRGAEHEAAQHLAIGATAGDEVAARAIVDACGAFVGSDPGAAAALLGDAARCAHRGSSTWIDASLARLEALALAERPDAVRAVVEDALGVALPLDAEARMRRLGALADAATGRWTHAVGGLAELVTDDSLPASTRGAIVASLAWLRALDAPDLADEHATAALVLLEEPTDRASRVEALAARALAALARGDAARAVALARVAVGGSGADERAVTVLACALEASGADAEARLWRESVAVGSTADPVLRRLVVSKAGEPPTTPEGRSRARRPLVVLTAKEREIGALLVEGATNAAIAEQLAVSRRTVEYHVSNLYAKSGVRTRTALAAWLRQAQEHPPGS